ncbi:glutathione peroxidase [Novosphingobium lentum]|uniref:glutathione peroxidase n=1 Tax=Novosphingobium lentum TaxID=145287 RepID=UPI0009FE3DD1|nr:glutathione peroxidase [Novosphingobium lentum]
MKDPRTIADFTALLPDGSDVSLADRLGKVVLVVNTASRCGFTPQYTGLEALWRQYRDAGLEVIAFPCNQFGAQEPGDAAEIASFCSLTYDVTFPMMGKIDVNGKAAPALWDWLKARAPGLLGSKAIKWNFTKFLIDREGHVVRRYAPTDKPESIARDIAKLL